MKNTQIGLVVLVLVVLAGGFMLFNNKDVMETDSNDAMMENVMKEDDKMMMADAVVEDAMMKETDDAMMMAMKDAEYAYIGVLSDVSGGTATGTAMANYDEDGYMMYATFDGLPALEDGYFYEGWIVRRGDNFDVISTGELTMTDGVYTNSYASGADLTDHSFYVLTLEPDDGDPAPAEHILEGVMEAKEQGMMEDTDHDDDDSMMEDNNDKMMEK